MCHLLGARAACGTGIAVYALPSVTWWISPCLSVVEDFLEGPRIALTLSSAGELLAALGVTGVWLASCLETTVLVIRIYGTGFEVRRAVLALCEQT